MARSSAWLAIALLAAGPASAAGELRLESDPPGARVFLDGRAIGRTPLVRAGVPDGPHQVVLRLAGYREGRLQVRVLPDLTTRHTVRLTDLQGFGELRVQSTPAGAQVLLDGKPMGRTPLHLRHVRPGEHRVVLRHAGYRDHVRTLRIVADLTATRRLAMVALPRAQTQRPAPAPILARPKAALRPPAPRPARPQARPAAPPARRAAAPPAPRAQRPDPLPTAAIAPHPERVAAPRAIPWRHVGFNAAMGAFLALLIGLLWRRPLPRADWKDGKPAAGFHPLRPGRVPLEAVTGCSQAIRLIHSGEAALGAEAMLAAYRRAPTVQMIYNLGLAWHLSGSPLAETAYRTALQLDAAHRDARYNLARLLTEEGRRQEALLGYREVVRRFPEDGTAWYNLGTLQARLGMLAQAHESLGRARRLLPHDAAVAHNLRLARRLRPRWALMAGGRMKGGFAASG